MFKFTGNDWCWRLDDGRVWSTEKAAFVSDDYTTAWLRRNGLGAIPPSPPDVEGNNSEAGLREALSFYGLSKGEFVTMQELQTTFTNAIQKRLDDFAKTRNYDDIKSAADYRGDPNPTFSAEGEYAFLARSATWTKGYEILNDVLSGQRLMPTWEEVEAALPSLVWPEAS